ncbi:unnamed protein product [Closterium sp. Yama58-4]|nr:unnamed protein product [Closterium sp. Yama58-4]
MRRRAAGEFAVRPLPLAQPLPLTTLPLPALRAQACSAQRGAARPGSILAGFEYPEHVCGVAWRDEYVQLHARIRAASRDAWNARKPPGSVGRWGGARDDAACRHIAQAPGGPLSPDDGRPAEPAAADDSSAADAPAVRFLTYGTCGGIGDYLIGLVSIFPAALLDRRALLVAQPCMHAAFHSPHIDTALSPDVPMGGRPLLRATPLDALKPARDGAGNGAGAGGSNGDGGGGGSSEQRVEWHAPPCERLEGNLSAEVKDSSAVPCFNMVGQSFGIQDLQRHSALSNYRMRYNHGLLITTLLLDEGPWAAALRRLGFKIAYGFGCILRFLFSPRPEVWQLVAGIEEQVWGEGVVRVAVHLRVPDQTVWHFEGTPVETSQQQLEELLAEANSTLQCAQTVEDFWYPPPLQVKWILITNSHPLKQALKAKYPDKVCPPSCSSLSLPTPAHSHAPLCPYPPPSSASLILLPLIPVSHFPLFLLPCHIPPLDLM